MSQTCKRPSCPQFSAGKKQECFSGPHSDEVKDSGRETVPTYRLRMMENTARRCSRRVALSQPEDRPSLEWGLRAEPTWELRDPVSPCLLCAFCSSRFQMATSVQALRFTTGLCMCLGVQASPQFTTLRIKRSLM